MEMLRVRKVHVDGIGTRRTLHRLAQATLPRRRQSIAAVATDRANGPPADETLAAAPQPGVTAEQLATMQQLMAAMAQQLAAQSQQNQQLLSTVTILSQHVTEQAKLLQSMQQAPSPATSLPLPELIAANLQDLATPSTLPLRPLPTSHADAPQQSEPQQTVPVSAAANPATSAQPLPVQHSSTVVPASQPTDNPTQGSQAEISATVSQPAQAAVPNAVVTDAASAQAASIDDAGMLPMAQPAEAAQSAQVTQPAQPALLAQPAQPAQLAQSEPPAPPAQAAQAAPPAQSAPPAPSAQAAQAAQAAQPAQQAQAAQLAQSAPPAPAAQAAQLAQSAPPAQQAQAAQAAQPTQPTRPAQPAQKAQPARSVQQGRPAQPAQPTRPVQRAQPARPAQQPTAAAPQVAPQPPHPVPVPNTTTPAVPAASVAPEPRVGSAQWLAERMRSGALRSSAVSGPSSARQPTITAQELENLLSKARPTFLAAPARDLVSILTWLASSQLPASPTYLGDVCGALLPQLGQLRGTDCVRCLQALAALSPDMAQPLTPRVLDPNHTISYGVVVCRLLERFLDAVQGPQQPPTDAADTRHQQQQQPEQDAGVAAPMSTWGVSMTAEACEALAQLAGQQPALMQAHGATLRTTLTALLASVNDVKCVQAVSDPGHLVRLLSSLGALGMLAPALPGGLLTLLLASVSSRLQRLTNAQLATFATAAANLTAHADSSSSAGAGPSSTNQPAPVSSSSPSVGSSSNPDLSWCMALEAASQGVMGQLSLDEAAAISHALLRVGHTPHQDWFHALMRATSVRLTSMQPHASTPPTGAFSVPLHKAGTQQLPGKPTSSAAVAAPAGAGRQAAGSPATAPAPQHVMSLRLLALSVAQLCRHPDPQWVAQLCSVVDANHASFTSPMLVDTLWSVCHMGGMPAGPTFNTMFMKTVGHVLRLSSAQQLRAACLPTYIAAQHASNPATASPLSSKWWDELQLCVAKLLPSLAPDQLLLLATSAAAVVSLPAAGAGAAGRDASRAGKQSGRRLSSVYGTALFQAVAGHAAEWQEQQLVQLVQLLAQLRESSGVGVPANTAAMLERYEAAVLEAAVSSPAPPATATQPAAPSQAITSKGKAANKQAASQRLPTSGRPAVASPVAAVEQLTSVASLMQASGHKASSAWQQLVVSRGMEVPAARLSMRALGEFLVAFDSLPDSAAPAAPAWLEQALPCLESDAYRKSSSLTQLLASCAVQLNAGHQLSAATVASLASKLEVQVHALDARTFVDALQVLAQSNCPTLPDTLGSKFSTRAAALQSQLDPWPLMLSLNTRMKLFGQLNVSSSEMLHLDSVVYKMLLRQEQPQEARPLENAQYFTEDDLPGAIGIYIMFLTFRGRGYTPDPEHMQVYLSHVQPHLATLDSRQLADLLAFPLTLGCAPSPAWLDTYQAAWSRVVEDADVATLGTVLMALVRLHDDSLVWTTMMEITSTQLRQCLTQGSPPTDSSSGSRAPQHHASCGLAMCIGALSQIQVQAETLEADGSWGGGELIHSSYRDITDQCILQLPVSLVAETVAPPIGPDSLLKEKQLGALLVRLAARASEELDFDSTDGEAADSEINDAIRKTTQALEVWLLSQLPLLRTIHVLEYLSFCVGYNHVVAPASLDKLVGVMERQPIYQQRPGEEPDLQAIQLVVDSSKLCCHYCGNETLAASPAMSRWQRSLTARIEALGNTFIVLNLGQQGDIVSCIHELQLASRLADQDAWTRRIENGIIQHLLTPMEGDDDAGALNALKAASAALGDGGFGPYRQSLVHAILACRLFGTPPSGFVESYRLTMLEQARAVTMQQAEIDRAAAGRKRQGKRSAAANPAAGPAAGAADQEAFSEVEQRQAEKAISSLPVGLSVEQPPALLVPPSVLAEYIQWCMHGAHTLRPDSAWFRAMCMAVLPTLEPAGSQGQDEATQWDLQSLAAMLMALESQGHRPGRGFQTRVAACAAALMRPDEPLEPAVAWSLLAGVCMDGYNPGAAWLKQFCVCSEARLTELTAPEYMSSKEAIGRTVSGTAAGIVLSKMLTYFAVLHVSPEVSWLAELCKVLAVVSREFGHGVLARIATALAVIIPLNPQNKQQCQPQLDVLMMELLTRTARAAKAAPDAPPSAAPEPSKAGDTSALSPSQVPPTAEEAMALRQALRALQGVVVTV